MEKREGMSNVQNIPGNTDFDDRPRSEEDRIREKDNRQVPPDTITTPINDPPYEKDKKPVNENPSEPQRIMRSQLNYDRRIF
jgi:hypothetical protein